MIFTSIIFSVIISLIFALILTLWFKREGPGPLKGLVVFFFIIFLFTLALGSLVDPIGPELFGQAWLPFVLPAFFVLLLIAVLLPATQAEAKISEQADALDKYENKKITRFVLGFFFWLLVASLLVTYLLKATELI